MYYKGMSLQRAGHKTDASKEYKELIAQFPGNDNSKKACTQLQALGIHCGPPAPVTSKRKKE